MTKNRYKGKYIIFIFFLFLAGCKTGGIYVKESSKNIHVIERVPFYKQIGNTCGPSALASLLNYWQIHFDYQKLIKDLYVPGLGGTLDFEIAFYPQKFNLWSKYSPESLTYLKERIKGNIPLIVLTKEFSMKGGYHYLVVFGFDDDEKKLLVHSGRKANLWISYKTFFKKWKKADFGTLTICPPEKVNWKLENKEYVYLGYLLEKNGKFKEAEEIYKRLIQVFPQEKVVYFNLGNVYFKMEEFDKAEASYRKAIELDKNFADAYNNLAFLYLKRKKNLREAENLIKKAVEINPEKESYLDTLNQIKGEVGDD